MTAPTPVILSLLKLPPEQQTLFRINEIPTVFMEKLGLLHLALSAYQDAHPCPPQATEILKNLRKVASDKIGLLDGVLQFPPEFARSFIRVLDLLEEAPFEDNTLESLQSISSRADRMAMTAQSAHDGMMDFSRKILAAIREITSVLDAVGNDGAKALLTPDNSQIIDDLTRAIDECKVLLLEIINYYHELDRHLQDTQSVKSLPEREEINVIRQRWTSFLTSAADLAKNSDLAVISNQIRLGPRSYDTEVFGPSWFKSAGFTPADSSQGDQRSPSPGIQADSRAILDAADNPPRGVSPLVPNSTAVQDAPPKTKRTFFRRLLSCLSIKRFMFWK